MRHTLPRAMISLFAMSILLPAARAQAPDDPSIELKAFKLLPGLDVACFAAEPMIANPIQIDFDPQGRLWVVTSPTYPHYVPGRPPDDKLVVLEDTDGDGKADKYTIFADRLYVPTGFALGDGGAYVSNQPELLFLKDTDGDGKADERRVLFSGFGTEDNHHAIHSYRWGPDGWLYFQSGIFLHNQVETPWGMRRREDGAMWRLKPRAHRLEFQVRSTALCNPWGHAFDRWGQDFWSEGPGGPLCHVALGTADGVAPEPYPHNRLPKTCGIEFVESRHFPDDWQGDLIVNAFKNRVVHRYRMSDDGASFAAKELEPLIQSAEEYFRPVDAKLGPDGALYIADWYNPIIGHMQYNLRDPRRDHTHGRIWRVTFKGRPLLKPPRLVGVPLPELLDHLKSPAAYDRAMARRVLYDMKAEEVAPALREWVKRLDPADPDVEHHRLEALWAFQTLDVLERDLLESLLRSKSPRARAAATRVLRDVARGFVGVDAAARVGATHASAEAPAKADGSPLPQDRLLDLLAAQAADDHPRVRLEAATALSWVKTPRAADLALSLLDRPMDPYLDYALKMTANALKDQWLPALEAGKVPFGGNARHTEYALQAVGTQKAVQPLLAMLREGKVSAENRGDVLVLIAGMGGPEDLRTVFDHLMADLTTVRVTVGSQPKVRILAALAEAAARRKTRPTGDLTQLKALLPLPSFSIDGDIAIQAGSLRLAGAWKLEALRPDIAAVAEAADTPDAVRAAAVDALADLGGPSSAETLQKLCAADRPAGVRLKAAAGLAAIDLKAAAARAAEIVAAGTADPGRGDPAGRPYAQADIAPLFAAFLQRKGGAEALAEALERVGAQHAAPLPSEVARAGLNALNAAGRTDAELVKVLQAAAGGGAGVGATHASPLPPEEMQKLIADVREKGDPARGEQVFRRKDMQCFSCHAISGAGGNVAPDLNGIGAGSTIDYLVESVLFPSKAVREGFQSVLVTTKDERVFTGVVARRNEKELVLRDATHDEIVIPAADIAEQKEVGSIMPTGLADNLTRQQFVDLVRFLSELGRPGAYAARNVPVVRRWEVRQSPAPLAGGGAPAEVGEAGTWAPVYSLVSGILPLEALPPVVDRMAYVRCRVEMTTPGKVRVHFNSLQGLMLEGSLFKGSPPVPAGPGGDMMFEIDLPTGMCVLPFGVDLARPRAAGLRVEFEEVPGSSARFRVVNGR